MSARTRYCQGHSKPKYDFQTTLGGTILGQGDSAAKRRPCPPPRVNAVPVVPVISIIDDDPSVRAATYNLVRSFGYVVHTFDSAEAFLQSPQLAETSCAIVDVRMPSMSGLDMQAHMRAQGNG